MISAYLIHLLIIICIYIILAVSLNLAVGYTGLLNLGHIAFWGIGGYTSALLAVNGAPYWFCFICAGILASVAGYLLTYITRKLKGDYLALATLGFGFVMYSVFLNWNSLTRGPLGIPGIPKPSFLGMAIHTNVEYLIFSAIVAAIVFLFIWKLTSSRYGKLLGGVRDDAVGLSALGKNIFKLKCQSMMISAFFAGIAGSVYAHYISFIDPSTFFLSEIILIFTIIMVGGLASLPGSIFAAMIIILIPEALRFVNLPSSIIGPMRQILYAILLILIVMYRPRGILGKIDLE